MSKKRSTGEKGASGQSKARDFRASAAAKALAERDAAVFAREQAADLREEAIRLREKALRDREGAVMSEAVTLNSPTENHLREANESLVLATVHAQTMAETAARESARMSYVADHDILTGLPNRSVLAHRLAQSIALAQRQGKTVALMYVDLDNFKHINDSFEHAVGDQLLQSVAKRLQACVRRSDSVTRQGGDEFVVLLAEVAQVQDAAHTAEKLIEAIAEPHFIDGHRLNVTLSIGISLYPDDSKDAEEMVRNADTAMYHAKRNGRNNYQRFSRDMKARAVKRQSVET